MSNCIFNALSECDVRETTRVAFSILDPFNAILQIDYLTNLVLNSIISYCSNCCSRIESICLTESEQSIEPYIQGLTEKSKMPKSSLRLRPNNLNSQFKPKSEVKALQPTINRENNDIIKLIYGSICDDTVMADVLVNSTNEHLDLKNGMLSNMLLKLGGQAIQDELRQSYPNGIKINETKTEIAISGVGNLRNKKKIFHTVLPSWDSNDNQKSSDKVKKIIKSLLDEAINNKFESICFPALGTGNLKYPIQFIPNLMFQAFDEYFSSVKNSTLKKVIIVIYDKDTEVIKAFKSNRGDFSHKDGINNSYSNFISNTNGLNNFYSNFLSNINGFSLNFGSQISVNVYSGDITKSNADVIFNPTSSTLEMGGNVSKALLNGGGTVLLNEIKSQKITNLNGFCLTSGGDLKCKSIIHFDVRSFDIKATVVLTLKALNEKNFKSIDFPVIGTGQANSKPQNCIEEMINGVSTFAVIMQHSNMSPSLTQINICVHTTQKELLKYFSDSFLNLSEKKHVDSGFMDKISQFMQKIEPNYDGKTIKIDRFSENSGDLFKIIADSKDKIVKVKSEIERLASLEVIKDSYKCHVLKLDQATKISIENICKRTKTSFMWENDRIKLIGRQINVQNCMKLILTAVLTAQKVRWEYLKNDTWFPFDLSMNSEIEHMFTDNINDKEITNDNNVTFVLDLKNMVQTEKLNRQKQSKIRRINLEDLKVSLNLPNHWLSNNYENIIDLKNTDPEYTDVYKFFNDMGGTGFIKKVVSIHRIQNRRLYIQYQTQKEQFEKIATSKSSESRLFHGTSHDCVQKIWFHGFDRNYAGKIEIFLLIFFKCKIRHS